MCTVIVKNKWLCGVGYWKIIIIIIIIIIGFVVCVQWWLENIGTSACRCVRIKKKKWHMCIGWKEGVGNKIIIMNHNNSKSGWTLFSLYGFVCIEEKWVMGWLGIEYDNK